MLVITIITSTFGSSSISSSSSGGVAYSNNSLWSKKGEEKRKSGDYISCRIYQLKVNVGLSFIAVQLRMLSYRASNAAATVFSRIDIDILFLYYHHWCW